MFVKQYEQCFDIHMLRNLRVEYLVFINMKCLFFILQGIPSASGGLAGTGGSKPGLSDKIRKPIFMNNDFRKNWFF